MTTKKTITLPMKPIAQGRPRFVRQTGRAYNPQETEAGKVFLMLRNEVMPFFDENWAVHVEIIARFKRPKNHYGTGKNAGKLKKSAPIHCFLNKDLDNIAKFYLDVLTGLAWDDDKRITSLIVKKEWSDKDEIVITYEGLKPCQKLQ